MTEPAATQGLIEAAVAAAASAYAPYSGFRVGAALRVATGSVFTGCNVENASFGLTVCAERVAVVAAVAAGAPAIEALAVVASGDTVPYPCGACLQVLSEFCGPGLPIALARLADPGRPVHVTLGDLLPNGFRLD